MARNQTVQPTSNQTDQSTAAPDMASIAVVILIILVAGVIGGAASRAIAARPAEGEADTRPAPGAYLLLGVTAAACVPLFLSLVQSDLVENFFDDGAFPFEQFLVFLGLCLIAAFSAQRFLESVSRRLMQDLEQVRDQQRNLRQQVQQTAELVDEQAATPANRQAVRQAAAGIDPASLPALDEDERRALAAMTTMTFRTATGIAGDIDMPRNQIGEVLDQLAQKQLAEITRSPKTGGVRWKITPEGIAALNAA